MGPTGSDVAEQDQPIDRRTALRWGARGAVAALVVATGCSSSSNSSAPTDARTTTSPPARPRGTTTTTTTTTAPARQPPATADQLTAGALVYTSPDGTSNHLGSFTPTPDGVRPTLVGLGDSMLACAYGLGTKSTDPATGRSPGPRTGLARWHDGKDPRHHDPERPSTSETARFGFDPPDQIGNWLPGARALVRQLPVDGCLVQASHALYGPLASSTQAKADQHLAELRNFVTDAVAKAGERGRFALTILFPPLVRNESRHQDYAASLAASRTVLQQLVDLRPQGVADGVRFEVETGWWKIVEPLMVDNDRESLLALHDPDDAGYPALEHPRVDQDGGIRYGELVVDAYERMGAFARTGR